MMPFQKKHRGILRGISTLLSLFMVLNIAAPAVNAITNNPLTPSSHVAAKGVKQGKTDALQLDYPYQPSASLGQALQLLEQDLQIYETQQKKAGNKPVLPLQLKTRQKEIEKHNARIIHQLDRDSKKLHSAKMKQRLDQIRQKIDQENTWYKQQLGQVTASIDGKNTLAVRQQSVARLRKRLSDFRTQPQTPAKLLPHRALVAPDTDLSAVSDSLTGLPTKSLCFGGVQTLTMQATEMGEPLTITFTQEIIDLANRLDRDPLKIYQYIRNQFDYEPYAGFIKGPHQTLLEGAGNDYDLAALLVATLRAAGYQARFAKGQVRLTIKQAMDWVGTKDSKLAAAFFVKNGIPARIEMTGAEYSAIVLDHVWVQTFVPYQPFQGAKRGEPDTWLNLDPSFKNYRIKTGKDVATEVGIDPNQFLRSLKAQAMINEEQSFVTGLPEDQIYNQLQTWSERIRQFAAHNEMTADSIYQGRGIIPEELGVLPAGLPYEQVTAPVIAENLSASDAPRFAVRGLNAVNQTALEYTNYLYELGGKRLTISYRPATAEDEQIIRDFGAEPNFPVYLVKVIPQIKLDGRPVASGAAIGMGEQQTFEFTYRLPDGTVEKSSKTLSAGTVSAVVLDLQRMPVELIYQRSGDLKLRLQQLQNGIALSNDDVLGEVLHQWGLNYYLEADRLNAITASALDVVAVRQPSHILISSDFKVEELFGVPYRSQGMRLTSWVGRDLLVPVSKNGQVEKEKQFLITSSFTASALQHGIFEQSAVGGDAVSVLKVIQQANKDKIPIITLTQDNGEKLLPYIQLTETQKTEIQNHLQAGNQVIIPQQNVTIGSWTGGGYMVFNPFSYATAYRFLDSDQSGVCTNTLLLPGDLFITSSREVPLVKALTVWAGQLEQAMESFVWQYIPAASVINAWFLNSADIDRISFVAAAVLLSCPIADFVTRPSIINADISTKAFSPNGDGLNDTVTVTAALTRPAHWKVTVIDAAGATVRVFEGEGQAITAAWDGKDTNEIIAAEAKYTCVISALDNEYSTQARPVVLETLLDLTAPSVSLTRPVVGSEVQGYQNVIGIVDDQALAQYRVLLGEGSSPVSWETLQTGQTPVIEGSLGLLDTTRLTNGAYALKIIAADQAGNNTEQTFGFTVTNANSAPKIRIMSPAGGTTVSGEMTYAAEVTDDQSVGNTVVFYLDGRMLSTFTQGPYQGRYNTHVLTNGIHRIHAVVYDSGGLAATSETVEFSVDNVLSAVTATPSPFSPDGDGFDDSSTISAALSSATTWEILIFNSQGETVREFSGLGSAISQVWDGKNAAGALQPDGDYQVEVSLPQQGIATSVPVAICNSLAHPVAEITAPGKDAEVSGIVEIQGTARSARLVRYCLEYRKLGSQDWTLIAEGNTSVTGGLLAKWDTTLLPNNPYEIRLGAEDALLQTTYTRVSVTVRGELKIGNYHLDLLDLQFSAGQLPALVARSYDTMNKQTAGEFGYGWTSLIRNVDLIQANDYGITMNLPTGRRVTFAFTPTFPGFGYQYTLGYPKYSSNSGYHDKLSAAGVNVVIKDVNGNYHCQDEMGFLTDYEPQYFKLETVDGLIYDINKEQGVTKISDRNGNYLTFATDGIHHNSGMAITFERDGRGRITKATDPDGRFVQYRYDENGDLVKFVDAGGKEYTYQYHEHSLMKIIGSDGKEVAVQEYDQSGRLKSVKDALGHSIKIIHDLDTRTELVVDRNGNSTSYRYDQQGNVVEQIDALGNRWAYGYDPKGNKLVEVNPLGETTRWIYDEQGNLRSEEDALGNITRYTYNQRSNLAAYYEPRLLSVQDPLGHTYRLDYGSTGGLTTFSDPLGNNAAFDYDEYGRLNEEKDFSGNITRYEYGLGSYKPTKVIYPQNLIQELTYDANGRVLTQTIHEANSEITTRANSLRTNTFISSDNAAAQNRVTINEYNSAGYIVKKTDPDGYSTVYEYNDQWKVAAVTDRMGRRTEYKYNFRGELVRINYPDYTYEEFLYDANGNLTLFKDHRGSMYQYYYDALNRWVKTVLPDGNSISAQYDAAGREIGRTNQLGHTSRVQYDKLGRAVKYYDQLNNQYQYDYDSIGNRITVIDALGNAYNYEYDANRRVVRVIAPNGGNYSCTYDKNGRTTGVTDSNGLETKYGHDNIGRLTSVTNPMGIITGYEYNAFGQMSSQIDAIGRRTRFNYDVMGRLTERILPKGQKDTYQYNPDGSLSNYTDANGNTTVYTYELNSGNLLSKNYADGTKSSYTYYADGLLKTATTTEGRTSSYSYDIMGRLSQLVDVNNNTIDYQYDAAGNRIRFTSPNGTVQYSYDPVNRLSTVKDQAGKITRYEYDPNGRQKKVHYGNGVEANYNYDNVGQLIELINRKANGEIVSSHRYGLSPTGHRERIEEQGSVVEYTYDQLHRLINEKRTGDINFDATYTYDAVGNRLTKTGTDGNFTYTYDDNDRLLSDGQNTYTYDANGNLLGKFGLEGNFSYRYNMDNHLVEASGPDGTTRFGYDALGFRVSRNGPNGNSTFLVDPNRPYEQVIEENTNGVIKTYTYGNDLIKASVGGNESWYSYDGLGNTRALTDAQGNVTDRYTYEAFGKIINRTGSTPNEYLFTGERFDPSTQLYHLRARYMDPTTGRFTQSDPWWGDVSDPLTLHKYMYCGADPVNYVDYSGYFSLAEVSSAVSIQGILSGMAQIAIRGVIGSLVGGALSAARQVAINIDMHQDWWEGVGEAALEGAYVGAITGLLMRFKYARVLLLILFTQGSFEAFVDSLDKGQKLTALVDIFACMLSIYGLVREFAFSRAITPSDNKGSEPNNKSNEPNAPRDTLKPGSHADRSIPARGKGRDFTSAERDTINDIGKNTGCHTCGSRDPGTKSGNFIPDHQPVSALVPDNTPQQLYPHCIKCSRSQGGTVSHIKKEW